MTKKLNNKNTPKTISTKKNGEVIATHTVYPEHTYTIRYRGMNNGVRDPIALSFLGKRVQNALIEQGALLDTLEFHHLKETLSNKIRIWGRLINNVSTDDSNSSDEDIAFVKQAFDGCSNSIKQLEKDFISYIALSLGDFTFQNYILEFFDYSEKEDIADIKRWEAYVKFSNRRFSEGSDFWKNHPMNNEDLEMFKKLVEDTAHTPNLNSENKNLPI